MVHIRFADDVNIVGGSIHTIKENKGAYMAERRGRYRVLVGKPERKKPLGRPRHRWEDNNKLDLQEVATWTGLMWFRIGTGGRNL